MTDPEHLTSNTNHEWPIIPRWDDELDFENMATEHFEDCGLGCDSKRFWLSAHDRCEIETRKQRKLLARDLQTLAELQQDEVSLNEVRDGYINFACFTVLNFVIGCNRLAQAQRLSLGLDLESRSTMWVPDNDNPHFKDTVYQAASPEQNLLIHTISDKDEDVTSLQRPVVGFKPDSATLKADHVLFSANHGTTSLGSNTRDILRAGPQELELISFRDLQVSPF